MKKILILVDQLHSHGGIEKLVAIKANYWSVVFGYEVTILSTEQGAKPVLYNLSEEVTVCDLKINYNRIKSYFSFQNILKLLKNIVSVQRFVLKEKPDFIVVASHIPITYVVPFLFGGAKTIKEFHFTKFSRTNSGLKDKLLTYIESQYDFLVVLSEEERGFYFSTNTVVIANPIEDSTVTFDVSSVKKENIAIAVGRFAPVKQWEKLIEIWSTFHHLNSTWKLHIFGEIGNDYYEKLATLVKEKNLQEQVLFKGQSNAIHEELAKAKVLLMTSEQECFPMVILEANAVGVPVISFDCPTGPRNIIHNYKDGILVAYDDNASFVKELITFASDKNLQLELSANAERNAKHYAIASIMQQWNELIFRAND
ncbi:MAG: glycosyltransferase [Flavobacteriaceae bacterium]|nr:glycosyltransferase [Flavobacteriaceae bacterium]